MLGAECHAEINSITNSGGSCGGGPSKQSGCHNMLWYGSGQRAVGNGQREACNALRYGQQGQLKTE